MKKIVKGNDFTMKIPVSKYDQDLLVKYSLPGCTDIEVSLISGLGKRYQLEYNIGVDDDDVIYAHVKSNEIPLGTYSLEVKGKKYGISWRSNEYEQVCFVDSNKEGDTVFEPDEGEDSVEMDTAIVILARDVDLIHDAISDLVSDLDKIKFDTSISPTKYYQKEYINNLEATINSSISDISNGLNNVSINVSDISTRLKNDYLKQSDFNSSYIELNNKIQNVDIDDKLKPINDNINSLFKKNINIDSSISDISTRLKNEYLNKSDFNSSYIELNNKIQNVDIDDKIDGKLNPITTNINTLFSRTDNFQNSLNNLIGTETKNGTIDTFTDIKKFLADISDSSTLTELLKENKGSESADLSNYVTKALHNSDKKLLWDSIDANAANIELNNVTQSGLIFNLSTNIKDLSNNINDNYYTKEQVTNELKYYISNVQFNNFYDNINTTLSYCIKKSELDSKIQSLGYIKNSSFNSSFVLLLAQTSDVETALNTLIGTNVEKNGTIDTFTDVKEFFDNISDASTLTELLQKNNGISEELVDSKISTSLTDYKKIKVISESDYNALVSGGNVDNTVVYMTY